MKTERPVTIEPEWVPDVPPEAAARLKRLRGVAWLMDRSIPIGGGRRIGLDPIIGLIPGFGDWVGAAVSLLVVYEAIRLGLPRAVIGRMMVNILIEAGVGAVPLLGDLFDAAWQANSRNLRLVETHYHGQREPRSLGGVLGIFLVAAMLFLAALAVIVVLVARFLWEIVAAA